MNDWKGVEMHEIAGAHIGARRRNWIVLTGAALAVAAGLVAAGRFTAPASKTVAVTAAPAAACGTLAPATVSPGCAHVLERAFGTGTIRSGDFTATYVPKAMPPRAAQQVLERAFGSGIPASSAVTFAPQAMPSPALQRVLEAVYGGAPLSANRP
jgi:hypothetical protein